MNDQAMPALDPSKMWECKVIEHDRQLTRCRFSPCGKFVLAGGFDRQIQRWDLESDAKHSFAGHASHTGPMAFHPDTERLFTGDWVGGVCCWRYANDDTKPLWSKPDAHTSAVRSLSVSPDGKLLATCGDRGEVSVWTAEGILVRKLDGHENRVFSTAFHQDNKSLVSGDQHGQVKHWDVTTGKLIRTLDASELWTEQHIKGGDVCGIKSLVFNRDASVLAASGIADLKGSMRANGTPTVVLFDWQSGKSPLVLKNKKTTAYADQVLWHPDGILIAGGHGEDDDGIGFWKPAEADPFHTINFNRQGTRDIDLHPDGRRLAVCHWKQNGDAGNSRTSKSPEEYNRPHHGLVRIFQLSEKPAEAAEAKS